MLSVAVVAGVGARNRLESPETESIDRGAQVMFRAEVLWLVLRGREGEMRPLGTSAAPPRSEGLRLMQPLPEIPLVNLEKIGQRLLPEIASAPIHSPNVSSIFACVIARVIASTVYGIAPRSQISAIGARSAQLPSI